MQLHRYSEAAEDEKKKMRKKFDVAKSATDEKKKKRKKFDVAKSATDEKKKRKKTREEADADGVVDARKIVAAAATAVVVAVVVVDVERIASVLRAVAAAELRPC